MKKQRQFSLFHSSSTLSRYVNYILSSPSDSVKKKHQISTIFCLYIPGRLGYTDINKVIKGAIIMTGRGFIHDKLEIKFLILYIAARVDAV